MNRVFEAYLKSKVEDMRNVFMRGQGGISEDEMANISLQDSSFAEILANTAQQTIIDNVIKLKGDVLFSLIQRQAGDTEFEDYLRKLLNDNKFIDINFDDFDIYQRCDRARSSLHRGCRQKVRQSNKAHLLQCRTVVLLRVLPGHAVKFLERKSENPQ